MIAKTRLLTLGVVAGLWLARPSEAFQDPHGQPITHAARATVPISVDGRLGEDEWSQAPVAAGFVQREPSEGAPATEATELRLLYDDAALYVGVRLHDSEPGRIIRQLSRRDDVAEADSFSLFLDPHHDHLTGVEFQVSAAGVQRDAVIYDDNFESDAWDAVWQSAVTVDAQGWVVEMRIPFSQLRFPATFRPTWGVNARRIVRRKSEVSWLALVPSSESGLASRMAHLEGIRGIPPARHLELLPYASVREEYIAPARPGNPFNDGSRSFGGVGLDVKYGLTSNMTMAAAINPDFGQVEVDPAVVNLTAYETFFDEKRPFFTEGAQVFSHFARSGASDYTTFFYPEPQLFYSRRIGRAPQGRAVGDYVDTPASTTILGAAKLTGRTSGGWTVGVVEAVTGRESARISNGLLSSRVEVEPLTHYFVGRAERELGARAGVGFLGTAVDRSLGPSLDGLLVSQAYVGGLDGHVLLDARRGWVLFGGLAGSAVSGSPAAILRLQMSAQRYYQRPDAPHVRVDPQATSLSGWSGRIGLNKNSGNVTANAGLWGISPGFEPNDAGFATQTDRGGGHGLVLWRKLKPDRWTRTRQVWVAKWWTFNYGRESQGDGVQSAVNVQLLNYWKTNLSLQRSWATLDDKLTRGGPTVIRPGIESINGSVVSDTRRRFWGSASFTVQRRDFGNRMRSFGSELSLKPWAALTLTAAPTFLRVRNVAQYLATVPDPTATATFGSRYVFGGLDQTELSMPLRVNLVLSPKLSVQLYTQALLSSGDYSRIKELAAPRTYDFPAYGRDVGTLGPSADGSAYVIDPDGAGPSAALRLAVPDFNVKALRANAVLRWEFRLGSTMYLVWTQRRQDQAHPGDFSLGRDTRDLFRSPSDDVFMIKVAWWLGR
ncbi:MAG TPA: DUF5916 domain-containing protein [Vicinamibacteria bacterium]|nr:DUF5916 domain-containing protein [Vicinamibacteria bacterium]